MVLTENLVVADRFRLVRMIGKGGMGSVWQAIHLGLDTPCAVKFIEGELANVAEAHARFEREAKAAAQLRSPNVVQIFDHGVWQGHPYIAMELLEGEDLGKRLAKNGGKLPAQDVNFVVQQVCRALSRAHQAGVVHRDMKPDNIFVVKDDDRDIVKILDFGVAKSAAAALDGSNTKTGAMLGTPYYMSPEQAQGIKTVDFRSDLWSLAVIVFQCLTGRLPFESEALGDLLVKIIVSPIPTPSHYFPGVPVGFDGWWAKAADRNPDNRFQTAKLFAETLSLALGQSSITDVTERGRLHRTSERPGGATAMMANAPATEVYAHVPNTPHPGAHTAAMAATPHPQHNTPQGLHAGMAAGQAASPQQQWHASEGAHGSQPGAGYMQQQSGPHATTGNPVAATFSGLEPAAGMPKKGPPVGLFVGIGVLALVGLGLGGVALVKGRGASAGGETTTSGSVAAPPASEAASAPVVKATETPPADPPATAAAQDPTPPALAASPASAASSAPPVVAAATPPVVGGGTHRPTAPIKAGGGGATVAAAKPVTPVTPPVTPVATAATTAKTGKPTEKAVPLGF